MSQTYLNHSDLPDQFPVFPLTGAVLFPRWQLPLNIFEPRYLNMIDDAMAGQKIIGMIQSFGGDKSHPTLAKIGCIGQITSYNETSDGRYQIVLSGLARFLVKDELTLPAPYRQVSACFADYAEDLESPSLHDMPPRLRLETALQIFIDNNGFNTDWETVEKTDYETLIHALASGCPFRPIEKQALVEAVDLKTRCEILIKLLSMNPFANGHDSQNGPLQ